MRFLLENRKLPTAHVSWRVNATVIACTSPSVVSVQRVRGRLTSNLRAKCYNQVHARIEYDGERKAVG